MEDLQKVGAVSALARSRRAASIGQDARDQSPQPLEQPHAAPTDVLHRSAVAAYAQANRPETSRHPLSRVQDIATRAVVTISEKATVGDAWTLLAARGMGQVPVVGVDGVLVGLLTRADLTRPDRLPGPDVHALVWRALLAQSVVEGVGSPVPSVAMDTDSRRVARVLIDTGLPGLPVVDDRGRGTGFGSRTDILRAVVADPPLDLWS
jgi:CBS domain-containing protein